MTTYFCYWVKIWSILPFFRVRSLSLRFFDAGFRSDLLCVTRAVLPIQSSVLRFRLLVVPQCVAAVVYLGELIIADSVAVCFGLLACVFDGFDTVPDDDGTPFLRLVEGR